jgi:hypothetical protein
MEDLHPYNSSTELSFTDVTEELEFYISSENLSFIIEDEV